MGTVRLFKPIGFWDKAQNNALGNVIYSFLDAPWVAIQTLNPTDDQVTHLRRFDPPQKDAEYLRTELLDFLQRCGEEVDQWENSSLKEIVEKVTTDYPSK